MVVSSRSAHAFGISMIRDDVRTARELFMAGSTLPVLLDNLPVQKFSYLGG